jgi:hypothetical protein
MTDRSLESLMQEDAHEASPDKLDRIRDVARERRNLDAAKASLEERLTQVNVDIRTIERETLPSMFAEARVDRIDIPAEGNYPACSATLDDYYFANIVASWDDARRQEGFEELDRIGLGAIVKTEVVVAFGRDQAADRDDFVAELQALGVDYTERRAVSWNTLTAAVRDLYERGQRLSAETLSKLGATVSKIVKVKPKKEPL